MKNKNIYDPHSKIHRILLSKKLFDNMDDQAIYDLFEGFCMTVLDWKFNGKYWRVKVKAYKDDTQKDVIEAFKRCGIIPY